MTELSTIHDMKYLVAELLAELKRFVKNKRASESATERWQQLFGAKEDAASTLAKLVGTYEKLVKLERGEDASDQGREEIEEMNFSTEDLEILQSYMQRTITQRSNV